MTAHTTLDEREQAHEDAARAARQRIEQAEESVTDYRSRMYRMQEDFYALAAREGVADDPGFRAELQRISRQIEENIHGAAHVIAGFEEELSAMTTQYSREREQLLHHRHP